MTKIFSFIGIILIYLISLLPHWILYGISDIIFFLIYHVFNYRKRVVFENIQNSFPEKTPDEVEQIARKFYKNLTDVMIETVKEFSISDKAIKRDLDLLMLKNSKNITTMAKV